MVFLRTSLTTDDQPMIRGHGVTLRAPAVTDYGAWADLRAKSRDHLVPWEPQWERDELDRATYRRRLKLYAQEARDDQGYAFFILAAPRPLQPVKPGATASRPLHSANRTPPAPSAAPTASTRCRLSSPAIASSAPTAPLSTTAAALSANVG